MNKKLKKDFAERQKIKEEAKLLGKDSFNIDESSKLKHGDDYRGKIIHDKDRFQDKIHEKISKRISKNELTQGSSKKNARHRKSVKINNSQGNDNKGNDNKGNAKIKSDYNIDVKDGRIYDPLGKDLDNDGIIDRYDNDFRDSDYFESTYDVEDNLHIKEDMTEKFSKKHKAQKEKYKKKNYSDKLYTRSKDNTSKEENAKDKAESKNTGKETAYDKEKKNSLSKEQKKALKNKVAKVSALSGLAKGSETVRDYLSHGSYENQGVETGEKIADVNSKLLHGIKNYADKKKAKKSYDLSKKDYKIRKRKSKLEFREAKEELKKTDEYKKADTFKRFQKRKQMKDTIRKQNKSRLRDRIKEGVINTLKSSKEMIVRKAKGVMMIIIGLIILLTFFTNFAGTSMTGMMNSTSGVLTTTYLSNQTVLSEINQQFSGLEEGLQEEIDSVEGNYPGYDEYIVNKEGEIGHNTHELLS